MLEGTKKKDTQQRIDMVFKLRRLLISIPGTEEDDGNIWVTRDAYKTILIMMVPPPLYPEVVLSFSIRNPRRNLVIFFSV